MTSPNSGVAAGPFAALMRQPYLILVLTNLFWGGNIVAGKLAVGNIDPYILMIVRWIGALILVLPFALKPLRSSWPTIRKHWWLYLFYGAVGYAAFNVTTYVAAYFTAGVNIAMEQVTINIFVMALNFAVFRTRVTALQIIGAVVTIAGVALIVTHGELNRLFALTINFGDGLVLFACVLWAIYSLSLKYRPQTDWLSFLFATCIGAALASFVFQAGFGGGPAFLPAKFATTTSMGWLIALYSVVFPSILSQMFYVRGVELIGANRASLFINLLPLFGTSGSVIVLGETLQGFHLLAAALIVVGIVLAEWSARRGQITVSEP
jgi:drug/metabolite transporter (DMT)-like permease